MMDGESVQQEVPAASATDPDASGRPPEPEVDPTQAADQRDPLKIHIRLSDLDAFRPRPPRWYCYQCRVVFASQRRLDKHLRRHVSEARLGVKLVRLPLPADVVKAAARRYREAEIALQKAADDFRDGVVSDPVEEAIQENEPFTLRLNEANQEEPFREPFVLRLNESDFPLTEDGIPEVQAEINSKDEEESLSEPASGRDGEKKNGDLYDRETILGPDLSKTLFEISKSVIRDLDAISQQRDPLGSVPLPVSTEISAAEKTCDKVVEVVLLPKPITDSPPTNITSTNITSANTTSANTPENNREWNIISIIDPKTSIATETPKSVNVISAKTIFPPQQKTLPVPKLIPDPVYTVTKTSDTGVNISISSSSSADTTIDIDPKTSIPINNNNSPQPILIAKNSLPELRNALSEPVKAPPAKTVPVVPLRVPESVRMEPERCQSVMILENESRVANTTNNNNNNNISINSISSSTNRGAIRPAPTLMTHLLAPPPPPNVTVPRPTAPRPLPPAILRAHWKFHGNNVNGVRPALKTYGGAAVTGPPSELKIQQVVSLAEKHLTEDFESTCACAVCKEVRCGDLWRKCELPPVGPNGPVAYRCVICHERFEGKSQLLRHCRRTKHCFICELCGSGFLMHSLYNAHRKVHEAKQMATKMAVSTSGGGVIRGPQPQHRTNDDEVTVVGERFLVKNGSQRTKLTNGSAGSGHPAQMNRILHNSEITLTPITAAGSNAGGKVHVTTTTGSNVPLNGGINSASLRRILPAPSSVAPPTYPLPMITTPISSTSAMSSLQELRKAVSSFAAHQQQQQQQHQMMAAAGGPRPTMPSNIYRMMPMNQSGPPRMAPTWHHPVTAPPRPPPPLYNRLPFPNNNNNQAPRQPLPANAGALSPSLRQQLTAMSNSPLYKNILPCDPRLRMGAPPNVSLAPATNGPSHRPAPGEALRAPPAVAPVRCHVCSVTFRSIVSFQVHFDQVHKKARALPPPQYKCKRCFKAFASIPQLQRHEPTCGDKVRCRKCNVLLLRSQVISHFALAHSEPGSGAIDPRMVQALAKHKQLTEAKAASSLPETEIIEVRAVTKSPLVDIRPSITVTPIPTPSTAQEAEAKIPEVTPNVEDSSASAEDLSRRPEVSTSSIPNVNSRTDEISVNVITVSEPEVVDISADSSIANILTARPEVNEIAIEAVAPMENSVEPEKEVQAVAEPEVYADVDTEAEIRKEMNLGLEQVDPEVEVSRSPELDVETVEPEVNREESDAVNLAPNVNLELEDTGSKASSPAISIPEFSVATPEAKVLDSEEPEVLMEVTSAPTPEIDLSMSPSICVVEEGAEERACVVCDRTFADAASLEQHLRTHTPAEPEAAHHTCSFCRQTFPELRLLSRHLRSHLTSCSTSPPKRTLTSCSSSPAKRPRLTEPEPPPSPRPNAPGAPEAIDRSGNLAVAILDMSKLGASVEMFRRLGVVGFVSLKELKSFLMRDDSTGSPNFIKKF